MQKVRMTLGRRKAIWPYIFLTPTIVGLIIFVIYPMLNSFVYSMYDWRLGAPDKPFLGIQNYQELLFNDPLFLKSLYNSFRYTVGTVFFMLALALIVALMLNQPIKGRGIFRTIYFIPVVSSMVAVSFVWRWLLEPTFGLINTALRFIGLPGPGWLASPTWAMPGIIMMSIWRDMGFYVVIFLTGLQTIPREIYEAALVDGANRWQSFWKITLPLLNPTIVLSVIVAVIFALQMFTQVYIMTGVGGSSVPGGPANSTRPLVLYIVQRAFRSMKMGYASAAAFILFILIFILTLVQFKIIEKPFEY